MILQGHLCFERVMKYIPPNFFSREKPLNLLKSLILFDTKLICDFFAMIQNIASKHF